jgi:tetratricopeptide (TPR) repeat protein
VEEPGISYDLVAGEMTKLGADSHQMGRFYLLQKKFSRAIQYLEPASREVGASAAVHNDLGVAYLESGETTNVDKSGSEFRTALRLDPSFAPAVFNLALFYERANRPAEAETQWKRYLELDPGSGWAKEAQGRYQGLIR